MRNALRHAAVSVLLVMAFQGCSAALTYTQDSERHTPNISIGATRDEVERELGHPVMTTSRDDGTRVATYVYRSPFRPTSGFWADPDVRRHLYLFGSGFTTFLSEIIFVPLEIGGMIYRSVKGEKHSVSVVYGVDDQVVGRE